MSYFWYIIATSEAVAANVTEALTKNSYDIVTVPSIAAIAI